MDKKEVFKKFVTEEIGGDIFFESNQEIRFFHPNKDYRQNYNQDIVDDIRMEIISKFNDYRIKNNIKEEYVFTVTISDDNPEYVIITIGF